MFDIENLSSLGAFIASAIPWMQTISVVSAIEQWGLFGVFIATAVPLVDAVAMVPLAIAFGLNPTATVILATAGDAIAILAFAFLSSSIRSRMIKRREARGKTGESPRFEKAVRSFDKHGIYAVALTAPALIGTQIAAMASVAAGVKPARASVLIIFSTLVWSAGIAIAMVYFDINFGIV